MKKFLIFSCLTLLITSCLKDFFPNYHSYIIGTWRCSSRLWCPNDSINDTPYTMEITGNDQLVFRRNNHVEQHEIIKIEARPYSDYAIFYSVILANNDTIGFGSAERPDPDFSNIVLHRPIEFFSCKNERASSIVMYKVEK